MIDTIQLVELYDAAFQPLDGRAAANLRYLAGKFHTDPALTDQRWRAYCLATVKTECGPDFAVRSEFGKTDYFKKYEPGTELGRALGNVNRGDGFLFRGRGYVQLTGRANYAKFGIADNPDAALETATACDIMIGGMLHGTFTGAKLSHFIDGTLCDWHGARRVVNGLDKADQIAADAEKFYTMLRIVEAPVEVPVLT